MNDHKHASTPAEAPRERQRLPEWLRVKLPRDRGFADTRGLLRELGLATVCQGARCPNIFECFGRHTATFLILGRTCTRACAFCNINPAGATPPPVEPDEPERLAEASARLGLAYVVITSVTRDDLPDGGAAHFAACIEAVRARSPEAGVEVLIPDFQGDAKALGVVLAARPTVLNHNLETVRRLSPRIRPQADHERSLELLRRAAEAGARTKSGLMVGLGETDEEIVEALRELAGVGVQAVTIGQYLPPSRLHPPVDRYAHPDMFSAWAEIGRELGVPDMLCGPLVRSSYRAGELACGAGRRA